MAKEFDMEEFIRGLNESVKFHDNSNMVVSVRKCRDCKPVSIELERVFKYGKVEYKNVDRSKEIGF